jgi:hypothetical protein
MPTLEIVCKRMFSDPSWFIKCIIGALLVLIPIVNFAALGYFYVVIERARHGEVAIFPDWEDWRGLFATGFVFFVLPVTIGWILSLPFGPALGPFSRLPMIPGLLLGPPLTAAAVYRYQRRDELREALRIPALWRMIESTRMRLVVPTLALIGLVVVGVPLLPFVGFTGSAVVFSFYCSVVHHIEESWRMGWPRA